METETNTMGIDITPEEMTQLKFNRKMKEYEKDEAFVALADFGLRDAIMAKPSVIANDNAEAYEMMVETAKAKMRAETSKQTKVDEPVRETAETKAPIAPRAVNTSEEKMIGKIDINSMDIFDSEKMKSMNVSDEVQTFFNINRPDQANSYGI